MPDTVQSWIEDGTPAAEPVTTETPVAEAAAPEPVEQAPPAEAAPVEAAAEGAEVPAEGASAQEIVEYIEAQLGDGETFQVPKGIRLPLKVQGKTEYAPIEEILKGGMLERDYRHKTGELAEQRRGFDQERQRFQAEQARLKAREDYVKEQEQLFQDAQKDPEKFAAFEEHLTQYQNNPYYRKMVDDALRQRETEAVNEVYRQRDDQEVVHTAVEQAVGWIEQIGADPKYQHVDKERVRSLYAQQLTGGMASLDPNHVRALFDQEADYLSRSVSPLQQQLADLKAQVESMTASQAADRQNETTAHAVRRAKTPPVAAGAAAPGPGARPKPKPFGLNELPDRISEWARSTE